MQETAPWFDPVVYRWICGAFGCLAGLCGALAGPLAAKGKARRLVMTLHWFLIAVSALLLAAGFAAVAVKQPYGVWRALLLPGTFGLVFFPLLYLFVRRRYAEVEMRKSRAADL